MFRLLTALLLVSLWSCSPSSAQQVNLFWACGSGLTTWCPTNAANPIPVTITSAPSGTQNVNLLQVGTVAVATGHGTAAGVLRVELPTDGTGLVNAAQSGTWNIGTVTTITNPVAVTGTFFQGTQPVSLAALPALIAGSAIIGNVRIDQTTPGTTNAVSLAQFGANTISTGLGAAGTGTLRVTLASDGPLGSTSGSFGATFPSAGVSIGLNNGGVSAGLAATSTVGDGAAGGSTLSSGGYYFNGSTWDRMRGDTTSGAWVNVKAAAPPTAIAPVVSTAAEANHVMKGSAGSLLTLTVTIGATSGYLLIFNSTTAPSDGAVTPLYCSPVVSNGTNGSIGLQWQVPLAFSTGITASFSTTGCFTKTASTTANFFGQIQ